MAKSRNTQLIKAFSLHTAVSSSYTDQYSKLGIPKLYEELLILGYNGKAKEYTPPGAVAIHKEIKTLAPYSV